MPLEPITLNGLALSTLGIEVSHVPGFIRTAERQWDETQRYGYPGARVTNVRTIPKRFSVDAYFTATSASELDTAFDSLTALALQADPAEVIFGIRPTRKLQARVSIIDPAPDQQRMPEFALFDYPFTMQFSAVDDPYWIETTETSVPSITTTPVELPQGSAGVKPKFRIQGPAADPTVILYYSTGAEAGRLAFTLTLGGSDYLCVDGDLKTVYQNTTGEFNSGTSKIGKAYLASATFFEVLEPHFVYHSSSWPTATCSSGTMEMLYIKRWR